MKKKWIKRGVLGFLGMLLVAQFFQIQKENPTFDEQADLMAIHQPTAKQKALLEAACYDCHSYKTVYPWYTYVVPVGQWINNHIKHGRKHLNFSVWGSYEAKKQAHKLEECIEEMEKGKMPLKSYTWTHGDAKLSAEDQAELLAYFKQIAK
ncbi:hypothetical protein SapgrDRAFT_0175 [Saprospira grandis DSM 2844]|uniref:Haem-binding domain-containing protein n=1 Tax=Saprospira grandis DSM 2844 TaxID=694433 RepID=J0NWQ3_9BACT|nr:heme-binding domain-containing protein [Saprospira grandis]EJF51934.1 hypothetical protein SapgrDRAFT_0175 [Saprospira grandis DSM 2844]